MKKRNLPTALGTPVRALLKPHSSLQTAVQDGLGAVQKADRDYLDSAIRTVFSDSLELDAAMRQGHEEDNRWDYLLGHQPSEQVVAVEPHAATQHQIATVIKKRQAAKNQLTGHLQEGKTIAKWLWVATGKVHFADTEKARRQLDQAGIEFVNTKILAKHLPSAKQK